MPEARPGVELRSAWEWTCDECGRIQFVSCVSERVSPEDLKRMMVEAGELEEWEDIPEGRGCECVLTPEQVTCKDCGATFDSHPMGDPFDEPKGGD
jgi:hypothetical protein